MALDHSLEKKAERLRCRVVDARASGQTRYSEGLAIEIVGCLAQLRDSHVGWEECTKRLGVASGTLSVWRKKYSESQASDMVRVHIRESVPDSPASDGLVLCTPNGHKLSGFTLGEVVELMRALG